MGGIWNEIIGQLTLLYPTRLIYCNSIVLKTNTTIHIDLDRMYQIIFNLLSNATRYSPNETPIYLSFNLEPGYFRIIVEDFGPGIPQNILFSIGKPFIQSDTVYSTAGTGLGLYIVKNIVQAHQGHFLVVTGSSGTTICVCFPSSE